jgi:hypothetical protein
MKLLLGTFFGTGALLARLEIRLSRRDAWWIANPVSMVASFVVHVLLSEGAFGWTQLPYEYYGAPALWLHALVGPFVYVRVLLAGGRLVDEAEGDKREVAP